MNDKKKKHLDEINAISKEESIGYYAPKASEINGIPTHNIPIVEIVAENPYKLTDYQKAQASKIKDNFRRGQYLKEQDYYNRTGRNKFTNDINYLGIEAQKRLGNLALSAIPGVGTVQPFIKYEDGKFKGDFSKEAFIQSGINTALDFIPIGDLFKTGSKKLIKQIKPYTLRYQLNKGIKNIPLESSITFNNGNVETLPRLRPILNNTKIALESQIAPRLKQLTQTDNPADKRLEQRINNTIEKVLNLETRIISNDKMDKLQGKTVAGYYSHDPKNIVFRSDFAASDRDEIHEASHAITHNIGNITKGRRLNNAREVLGEFTGYAEKYYDNLPKSEKNNYQTDEFISDMNAFRYVLLSKKDPNNNLFKSIQRLGTGLPEKDINELLLIGQKTITDQYTDDELISIFSSISQYAKDFVEKYKNNPNFPNMLRKALNKVGVVTGLIGTQNDKE